MTDKAALNLRAILAPLDAAVAGFADTWQPRSSENDPCFNAVEYVYRLSSTNGHAATICTDGRFSAVISLEDPSAPNWLDPAGYTQGTIYGRWYDCSSAPTPTLRRVKLAELRARLPADTPVATPPERADELASRVHACQRRRRW